MRTEDIERLFSRTNEYRALRYDLVNTRTLLGRLGRPEESLQSALVAGTNGKGAVARWLSAMVPECGLYTSPHLSRLNERITIDGAELSDSDLDRVFQAVEAAVVDAGTDLLYSPTFFERTTAMAFSYFSGRVSRAVLEVGMGGRLDSTNVVDQDVSVITTIGLDHEEHLGSSLDGIAQEKAGIIKANEPVVVGRDVAAHTAIASRAGERLIDASSDVDSRLRHLGQGLFEVDIQTPVRSYRGLRPRLAGRHQIDNLSVAIRAAECLEAAGWPIDGESIENGANSAIWPGRLERVAGRPSFLLDGCHNLSAAASVSAFLEEFHPEGVWLIFGAMEEKDYAGMLRLLAPHLRGCIFTRPDNSRAVDVGKLSGLVSGALEATDIETAIELARARSSEEDTVLVAGSLYLVGEARSRLIEDSNSVASGES